MLHPRNCFLKFFGGRETYLYSLFAGYVIPPFRGVVDN
jgi:hypothetical protein